MTASISSSLANLKLKDQLTCAVCLDHTDPRTLPCLHSFCTKCLEGIPFEDGTHSHSIACPTCRKIVELSEQGITSLPKAFLLSNLLEVQDLLKRASGEKKPACDSCHKKEAIVYCQECDTFICSSCNDDHGKWTLLSTHKVMSIGDISIKAMEMAIVKPSPVMNCPIHTGQRLDLYCVTCEQPICYHCTIKGHKGHDHDLVSDAYDDNRRVILERVEAIEEQIKKKNAENVELEESKVNAQKKGDELRTTVNNLCNEFVQKIEEVRALGLHSIDTGVSSLIKCENQRIKNVEADLEALNNCKEHVERTLQMNSPTHLLTMKKQVIERIDELVGKPNRIENVDDLPAQKEQHSNNASLNKVESACSLDASLNIPDDMPPLCGSSDASSYTSDDMPPLSASSSSDASFNTKKDLYSVENDAIEYLRSEIISSIRFEYPNEAYKHCECVAEVPKTVETNTVSTGTFALLYQGEAMIVDKNYIACSFVEIDETESVTKLESLPCEIDFVDDGSLLKYKISFNPQYRSKLYGFTLEINHIGVDTHNIILQT